VYDDPDQIESPRARRTPLRVAATLTAVVVIATVVVIDLVAAHHHSSPPARAVAPSPHPLTPLSSLPPTPAAPQPAVNLGTVFLEPLAECLQTDHRQRLRVALAVTNLTNARLRLITATPETTLPGLRLAQVRYWTRPCGAVVTDRQPVLPPSRELVVAFTFDLGPECPYGGIISSRITFESGGHQLRAESTTLVDLTRVGFKQCRHG